MNKILIKVYVPLINQQYDVFISLNKKLHNVAKLLAKAINELSGGYYDTNKIPVLYNKIDGKPYNPNIIVKESNIRNGTEIIMI